MKFLRIVVQMTLVSLLVASPSAAQTPGPISIGCDGSMVSLWWGCAAGKSYMLYATGELTSPWLEVETVPKPLIAVSNRLCYSLATSTNRQLFFRVDELTDGSDTNCFELEITTTNSPQDFICRFLDPGTLHVDWGDGSTDDFNSSITNTHAYATAGVYTIRLSGHVHLIDLFVYPDPGIGTPKLVSAIKTPIRGITGLNSAYEMFKHCENITDIPAGLFDQCPGITTFYDTFLACKKITAIPPGLFSAQSNAINFYAVFDNCDLLKDIPAGLFDRHTNNVNFAWLFAKCYSLTNVPAGLFNRHAKVTTFDHVFYNCYTLPSLSPGIFTGNPLVTTFAYAFYQCRSLTSVPQGLFDQNKTVTTFAYTFYGCTNLTSLPAGLFANNTNVTTFSSAFENCLRLTGESPTGPGGKKLWDLTPTPVGTGCFRNCTNLTDYNTIPAEWK